MTTKVVFATVPAPLITYRISQAHICRMLDISRRSVSALAAQGHFGEGITYHEKGHLYYELDKVNEFQKRRAAAGVAQRNRPELARAMAREMYNKIKGRIK